MLNARELHARYEINLETYVKTLNVEAQVMVLMANRYMLPAALEYQTNVARSVKAVKDAGGTSREAKKMLDKLTKLIDQFRVRTEKLSKAIEAARPRPRSTRSTCATSVIPAMNDLREAGDQIELLIPHELWPLPTYREMLFVK